jgi:VanZ family protein
MVAAYTGTIMKSKNLHVGKGANSRRMSWPRAWWPALLVAAGIFAASSTRGSKLPGGWLPGMDKAVHAAIYALLAALVARAHWLRSGGAPTGRSLVALAGLALAYGVTDEVHQLFVPGRQFELADLAADALGAALGVLLMARRMGARRGERPRGSLPSQPPP